MELPLKPHEEAFRQEFRQWLEANLPAGWLEGKRELPQDPKERERFLRDWQRRLYEGGWAGIAWPKEYGGRGASLVEQCIYEEELVRVQAPPFLNTIAFGMIGPTLIQVGTPEQKERFLPPMLRGEEIWCQGYSEPNAGSDLASLQTRAVNMGDHYVVNGQKIWTSYAHVADWCFLLCRTDPTVPKHKGLSVLLVDMKSPGIEVRPIVQMNGEANFNEVFFTDVKVPKENLVGQENDGWRVAVALLMHERRGTAASLRLKMEMDRLVEICRTRTRNGRPLIEDPVVRDRLARLYAEGEVARLLFYRGIHNILRKGAPGPEGSADKLYSTEVSRRISSFALELLGEEGLYEHGEDGPADARLTQLSYFNSIMLSIAGGTSQIQRNIIAERVLRLPKD